jgi:hypothetical protein
MKTQLPPPSAPARRPRWSAPLVVTAVVLGTAAVVLVLLLLRATQPPSLSSITPPSPAAPVASNPSEGPGASQGAFSTDAAEAAYITIQRQRDEAYRRVDSAILRSIYAPDCVCLDVDLRDLDRQRRGGYHFDGPAAQVRNVRVTLDQPQRTALVVAEVNYGASRYVDNNGNVRFVERNQGWQTAQTILTWDGRRWRVAQVVSLT